MSTVEAHVGADYHGRSTRRLANDRLWVDVLVTAGPRIIRLGLAGSDRNLLAETPDLGWDTPHGRYELFGGHRLWFAPEDPDLVAVPDGSGLDVTVETDGVSLTGQAEEPDRPRALDPPPVAARPRGARAVPRAAATSVTGRSSSRHGRSLSSRSAAGCSCRSGRPPRGHFVRPNRTLVLWPYTSWEDPRFRPKDGLLTLDGDAGPDFKLGYFNDDGWVAYARDGVMLVRRFDPQAGQPHPDLGCNAETYIGARYVELELLGPLVSIDPGSSATLVEHWHVTEAEPDASSADLQAAAGDLADVA